MMQRKGALMASNNYKIFQTETFIDSLKPFKRDKDRIYAKIEQMLSDKPDRYERILQPITIKGVRFSGLRHMKIGIKGLKGGLVVLYRICHECLKNAYYKISQVQCSFCNEKEQKRVVLFTSYTRSHDYK